MVVVVATTPNYLMQASQNLGKYSYSNLSDLREADPRVCTLSPLPAALLATRLYAYEGSTSTPQAHARMCHSFHVVIIEVVLEICGAQVGERTCAPLRAGLWAGGARRAA